MLEIGSSCAKRVVITALGLLGREPYRQTQLSCFSHLIAKHLLVVMLQKTDLKILHEVLHGSVMAERNRWLFFVS